MVKDMPASLIRWSSVVGYCALIFYLSSYPSESFPALLPGWHLDKVVHAVEFGLLSLLIAWALGVKDKRRAALTAIVLASLYSVSDEFHQYFVPGRDPSLGDWLASTAGASVVQLWRIVARA